MPWERKTVIGDERKKTETRNERCIKRYKLEDLKLIMKKKISREKERARERNGKILAEVHQLRQTSIFTRSKYKRSQEKKKTKPTDILNVSTFSSSSSSSRSSYGRVKFNHLKNWFRFSFSSADAAALVLFHLLLPMLSYLFTLLSLHSECNESKTYAHTHNLRCACVFTLVSRSHLFTFHWTKVTK